MATSSRALLVAFLAVVAAFIGATIWAQHAARGIDADTLVISREAAPAIAKDLVDYNARLAEKAAMRIEEERTRANRVAYQLDALCALLAMAAALLALRVVRQVHFVQEAHQRLIEAKAEELEQFAGRVAHDVLSPPSAVGLAPTLPP